MQSSNENKEKSLRYLAKITNIPQRYQLAGLKNFNVNYSQHSKTGYEYAMEYIYKGGTVTLTGRTGTGKTHLAIAMLKNYPSIELPIWEAKKNKQDIENNISDNYYKEVYGDEGVSRLKKSLENEAYKYRPATGIYLNIVEFFMICNEKASEGKKKAYFDELNNYDCVMIDDLGAEKLTETTRLNLYYLTELRYRDEKSMILTANNTIEEINSFEPRVASRLAEMGKILYLGDRDYRLNPCK